MTDSDIRTLKEMYAITAKRLPKAKAISIMAGIQTDSDGETMEWWSVAAYSTPIGKDSVITARGSGDTFDEALSLAVKRTECACEWIASYTADDQIDGYDCPKCGAHKEVEEGEE